MRNEISKAKPNAAHYALSELENRLSGETSFTLITQNIDRLHKNAGSRNVVELHGDIFVTRCINKECELKPFEDLNSYEGDGAPICTRCGSYLRPGIVLFNEQIPIDEQWTSKKALRDCDLFIAIGTSGAVSPASNFVRSADYEGARTILINLTEMEPNNPNFREVFLGKAEEVVPELFGFYS